VIAPLVRNRFVFIFSPLLIQKDSNTSLKYTQTKVNTDHPQERIGKLKMLYKFWNMVINNIIDKKSANVKFIL